jgi:integrase
MMTMGAELGPIVIPAFADFFGSRPRQVEVVVRGGPVVVTRRGDGEDEVAGTVERPGLGLAFGRGGELLGLRWDDIDPESRQLHVRRALQRVDGSLRFVKPKTETSLRTVVLPKLAVRYLREHSKRQNGERLTLGETWQDHGLVFASSVGTPIEPRNVNRRWDQLRGRAGLDSLRLHDLRHGCATFLLAAGIPARAIMEVLGHSEIGVTMNTYAHVLPQLREDAADAIDELFGA